MSAYDNQFQFTDLYEQPAAFLGDVWNNVSGKSAEMDFNAQQAAIDRGFQSQEAQKNRLWQEYMSSSAHQREVEDLKSAGLNPALATGMSGASSPSGAMVTGSQAHSNGSGNGGILGLAARVASAAIAGSLATKFSNSAKAAGRHGGAGSVVKAVQQDFNSAKQALLNEEADRIYRNHMKHLGLPPDEESLGQNWLHWRL